MSKNIENIVEPFVRSAGSTAWIPQEGDANLEAEFTQAIFARDFSKISDLLSKTFSFIFANAIAQIDESNQIRSIVAADWIDAVPSNITVRADQLFLSSPQWRAVRPVMLGELLLRVVDEIAKIDFTLEDTRRETLIALLSSNGLIIGSEIVERYNLLVANIQSQLDAFANAKIEARNQVRAESARRAFPILNQEVPTPDSIASFEKFNYGDEFKDFICPNPFLYGELRADGEMATCCYLPFTLGNINKQGLKEAWNSPIAQAVRRSVLDGSYTFCDKRKCATMQQVTNPEKQSQFKYQVPYQLFTREEAMTGEHADLFKGQLELASDGPKIVSFEDDPSCNLACPSCRVKPTMISKEESVDMYQMEVMLLDELGSKLEEVWFAGAGDPFVSRSYRKLYKEYDFQRFPKLKFRFDTNGVPLTPKTWNELLAKVKNKVGLVCVSVDAATKETYDITRVGGNWEILMSNLKFISQVPERSQGMGLLLRLIVQRKNFREMKAFVNLGKELGANAVVFSVIQNWGHYDKAAFVKEAVHLSGNPHHKELREILSDPLFDDPIVNLGNLSDLYFEIRTKQKAEKISVQEKPQAPAPNSGSLARAVAFYLPQFHPIPENDQWWGKGFTEWANVAKGQALYHGHHQPNLPADLGFYDLRLSESREAQAELARVYGVEAFCYWHYWFAGKQLLERPLNDVLRLKKPDLKFMIGWANSTWTGIWHGDPKRTLIEQTYPGIEDYRAHFMAILPALRDDRYFRINNKATFLIYAPHEIPNCLEFTNFWRELAHQHRVGDLHFIAHMQSDPVPFGCDSAVDNAPFTKIPTPQMPVSALPGKEAPRVWSYKDFVEFMKSKPLGAREHPLVFPNWDNTPRSGARGLVLHGSTPQLYEEHLGDAIKQAQRFPDSQERIVFIKAWNEWAEGNYLEPDGRYGHQYLEATKRALYGVTVRHAAVQNETSIISLADSLAGKGEYQRAIEELTRNSSAVAYLPGIAMRFAEWNLALGRSDEAARNALKELSTRPDNRRAFDIAFHDKEALVRVIETSPPAIVQMFHQLIKSYSEHGGIGR